MCTSIQRSFNEEYKQHPNVDIKIRMPKLHKLRKKQNKVVVHLFEGKIKVNIKLQDKGLLDIDKAFDDRSLGT
ncbi:hypothetical protein KP509_09G022400 [Ceratopteris richardii]|uniref:Uncharacterized protein n=1 Tax=Ceratopteris richardii TaxID=49495 RepID=A0A8T2U5L9_CERRI|nr:hypothetical protein KP509_09G022400 [Ceratopteris richardii]